MVEGKAKPGHEILWLKGQKKIDFHDPNIFYVLGRRGAGKSAYLENLAYQHLMNGCKILDLFGSKDGEGLSWLRSNVAEDFDIQLIHGPETELKNHEGIDGTKFRLNDLKKGDIFISSNPLYASSDNEFEAVNNVFETLWNRTYWNQPIFIVVREAANLLYSRIKVSENQTMAKAELTYMLRESRHSGLALGLDSVKHTSVDVDIRKLTDFLVLKNLGMHGLPRNLHWIYKYLDPQQMSRLKSNEFGVVAKENCIGLGTSDLPRWHKDAGEHILQEVGVNPKYYQKEKESEQAISYVREALEELHEPTPTEVSEWIKKEKNVKIAPEGVGRYAKKAGYYSDKTTVDGKQKNLLKPMEA